jgi:hypothetical protein
MHYTNTQGWLRICGISLQDISQARNFNPATGGGLGANVVIKGGMGKGLPLANPSQARTLITATVMQAYGNWIGTSQTLEFQFLPGGSLIPAPIGLDRPPVNLSFNWPMGMPLADAIKQSLAAGYPNAKVKIQISPNLKLSNDEFGFYGNFNQFSEYLFDISKKINTDMNYPGVTVALLSDGSLLVSDNTQPPTPKQINFTDLVGQPTWIGQNEIQITTVMGGDLNISDIITLPPGQVTTTPQSSSQFRQGSIFTGNFLIKALRHLGNFRSPDGTAWVTTINALAELSNNTPPTPPVPQIPAGNVTIEDLQIR